MIELTYHYAKIFFRCSYVIICQTGIQVSTLHMWHILLLILPGSKKGSSVFIMVSLFICLSVLFFAYYQNVSQTNVKSIKEKTDWMTKSPYFSIIFIIMFLVFVYMVHSASSFLGWDIWSAATQFWHRQYFIVVSYC